MVLVQASKLTLPTPSSLSSPPHTPTSLLFEPTSLSLALTHFDSSISLYPSFSTPSSSSSSSHFTLPSPQTLIPSPSSSSTFLLLKSNSNPDSNSTPRVLFIVSGPHRSQILLRFFLLNAKTNAFVPAGNVLCSQKDLRFESNLGVLVNSKHGVSIKLAGSVNYFAMYSVSCAKVWVFAAKTDDGAPASGGGDEVVRLMRCAVIECSRPVWSVSISFGLLLLGEENGVRVFGLRRLVKGRVKKVRNSNTNLNSKLPNGVIAKHGEGKIGKHGVAVKQTNVKQNGGVCFVALKGKEVEKKTITKVSISIKVISIQALSQRMFLILDSDGDLHLLCLSNSGIGVDITGHVRQLTHTMKVQNLAVLPDVSTSIAILAVVAMLITSCIVGGAAEIAVGVVNICNKDAWECPHSSSCCFFLSRIVWISDGCHSMHLFNATDVENALNEADGSDGDEKLMHLPVNHVLFSSEKIQDVICLASNSILVLGQGKWLYRLHVFLAYSVVVLLATETASLFIGGKLPVSDSDPPLRLEGVHNGGSLMYCSTI
ncbi:hypothetical protein RIF29_19407 [Crotalaria pallida]|uniref:Uncharacterized protein n=1 Tax=Crotalaria pallida TaxID=3830 RepID=A0AAN9I443_CROPI